MEKALLFTRDNCRLCAKTKKFISELDEDLTGHLKMLSKEKHTALVQAYRIQFYPTVVLLDYRGFEIDRMTGGEAIRFYLESFLSTIHQNASSL